MGRAKNGTASNRDNLPAGGFSLAAGVLDRIESRSFVSGGVLEYRLNAVAPRKCHSIYGQGVMAITVKDACLGEASFHWRKTNQSAP